MIYDIKLHDINKAIQEKAPGFTAKIGLILGSGLGKLSEKIEDAISISYQDLPHFPMSTVAGHAGRLILGKIAGCPVACLQGRVHLYEGHDPEQIKIIIRTLKILGCSAVIITNAAGSLRSDINPGELLLLNDHINFQFKNPLIGPNEEEFGPRFFSMDDAYNQILRHRCLDTAKQLNIPLKEGVYCGVLGPCFETPAEIRAFRTLGADAVGMSTVPEVIVARHCDLRVLAISAITNLAAGMSNEHLSHEGTLHFADIASLALSRLVYQFIKDHAHEL